MSSTNTYAVSGMACGHCAEFITDEVKEVAGVTAVAVDVDNGTVTVETDRDVDIAEIRGAVEEAGYELTG